MTTKNPRSRGRPRNFDPEAALASAQNMFHARGYEGVSVADLTEALGINPPSFYAAFGSKAALYARSLDRYVASEAIPFERILRPGRPVAEALTEILEEAARRYSANPAAAGCLVVEGAHAQDPEARAAATALAALAEAMVHDFIAATHPKSARRLTDFLSTQLAGLSAQARQGQDLARLRASARLASLALEAALAAEPPAAEG